jgi:ABC-type amino acid transport substrate-binding protein
VEFIAVDWDGIIPGLLNGNFDCIISAMTITDERKAQINFSVALWYAIRVRWFPNQDLSLVFL